MSNCGLDWPSGGNGVVWCPGALPSTTHCTVSVRAAVSGHVLLDCPHPGRTNIYTALRVTNLEFALKL